MLVTESQTYIGLNTSSHIESLIVGQGIMVSWFVV